MSVVIPALNAASTLARAVQSALDQDYAGNLEVIVAVGPSRDGTTRIAESLDCLVVENPAGTTPAALNNAIRASSGSVIVRLDAHAELPAGYVSRAVETLAHTGAANVGGVQRAVGRSWFQRSVAFAQTHPLGVGDARYRRAGGEPGPVDTVYLGVFDRAALEAVGLFEERYVRNQDYELNWRLRKSGRMVWFDPALEVTYLPRSSVPALARQYFEYGRWKRLMLSENPASLKARQLAPPLLVIGLLGSAGLAVAGFKAAAALVPGIYAFALAASAVATVVRSRDPAAFGLPVAVATMHVSWGAGFLRGGLRP